MKYKIGNIFKTKQGSEFGIIEVLGEGRFKIKFLEYNLELYVSRKSIREGTIKNPYAPSVFGIGYLGIGEHKAMKNKKFTQKYVTWKHMMERSYDPKYHARFPTYKNVSICEEWCNFQNFAEWFEVNYIKDYQLDKDLLQMDVKNKVYSPKTCLFLPSFLNSFLTQSYSNSKSGYKGVTYDKPRGKWMVTVFNYDRRVNKNLGRFKDIKDAIEVYRIARCENVEKIKSKARLLNYLSEETIQLIK